MEVATQLELYLQRLNRYRRQLNVSINVLRVVRSLILALCAFLIWAWLSPEHWAQQLLVFAAAFIAFLFLGWQKGLGLSSISEWLLALEMAYPQARQSAFHLQKSSELDPDWKLHIDEEFARQRKEGRQLLGSKAASLVIPLLALLILSQSTGPAWAQAIHAVKRAVLTLSYSAQLRVVEGAAEEGGDKTFTLGRGDLALTVLEQNLIAVEVQAAPDAAPLLQLKDKEGKALQTFRLMRSEGSLESDAVGRFAVTFALRDDAALFLSTYSTREPAARIAVKKLPVPRVSLRSYAEPDVAWPDDKPLPLDINVKAEYPLKDVHLVIKSGERSFRELVSDVLAQDKYELATNYSLPLESYLEQDIQDIEITAEASDRALPVPLVGRSETLVIRVASAYGRYRQTLDTLKQVKTEIDQSLQDSKEQDHKKLRELTEKAALQAEESPYFDGLDRQQIREFQELFEQLEKKPQQAPLVAASEQLNRFLFEHESLDDRERDRDFFVAARTLSRLLEQKPEERKVTSAQVIERAKAFLLERRVRWQVRVDRLNPQDVPPEWAEVQKESFAKALSEVQQLDSQNPPGTDKALQVLSKTVESYRQWIESLEAKEDQARQQQEQKRQQGLANAQNELRELQRRQSGISSKLDKAAERDASDLGESWASVRLDQNSNIEGTGQLEGQMRSMSPGAAERIRVAKEAMEATVEAGNSGKFAEAESASDFAGRLLQQAESAARRSQQEQGSRGRRRRVSSDQYYGNQVAGGDVDLRRDYQVNRRYREDVLDDVRQLKKSELNEEGEALLEDYLRKVIR